MAMAFRLDLSAQAKRDFGLILDHFLRSHISFGESVAIAIEHAEARLLEIRATADRILTAPHRGERYDDILSGLRHLTINRAIYWFEVNEEKKTVRILAVFFGGQDQVRPCWLVSSTAEEM